MDKEASIVLLGHPSGVTHYPGYSTEPNLMVQLMGERDARMNNFMHRSPLPKCDLAFCSVSADQWGCKYRDISSNPNVPVTQPPMLALYQSGAKKGC